MPHERLKIVGGVDTNRTPALNQAALSSSQCIRYMPDAGGDTILVQKLGGWAKYFPNQISSVVRALWPWNDQNDISHLAVGADEQLAVITEGVLDDITPNSLTYSVPVKFETTAGSSTVKVTDGANYVLTTVTATGDGVHATLTYAGTHVFAVGSSINVSGVTPAGFNGNYIVTSSSAGSVSYASTTTGPQTVAGTVQNQSATTAFDVVYIQTPVTVGGLTLFGFYATTPLTSTTYNITALDLFGAPQLATYSTVSKIPSSASGTGTVATLVFSGAYTFPVGTQIVVAGATPTLYNGNQIVTTSTALSVSYASAETGVLTVSGTITDYGSVAMFSMTQNSPVVTVTFYNHGYQPGNSYPMVVETLVNGLDLVGESTIVSVLNTAQFTIQLGNNAVGATTTGASGTGATATLLFNSGNFSFAVGATILVAGVTPAGYNGTYTVTASTSTSVSYASATTGSQTIAGTVWVSDTYIPQNSGLAQLEYFIGTSTVGTGAGFGSGGFGSGGFGVGVAPAPAAGVPLVTTDWFPDNWGSILVACAHIDDDINSGSPVFYWDPTQPTPSASVITQGPLQNQGIFVAMPQRQIVAWGSTFNGIQDHLLVRWCDVDNFTVWIGQPQNQAGSYRLPRGSRIIAGMQTPQQGLLWTDIALWSMQYIGQPYVYSFDEIATGCGLIAPKAMGVLFGAVYWMSQSQFFMMDGNGASPLPCSIWDAIFQQLDKNYVDHIRCAPNSRFGEISFFIPITGSSGEVGFCAKYNVIVKQWDLSVTPLTRTAWTNQSILGAPIGAGTDRYIYQHEEMNGVILLNNDTAPMTSYFTTGWFALAEGSMMQYLDQFWPDMDWGLYNGTANANVQITFETVNYPGDTPVVYGPYTVTQATGYFTPRFRGRLVRMTIGSSDIDSFWRNGANRYRIAPDGKF